MAKRDTRKGDEIDETEESEARGLSSAAGEDADDEARSEDDQEPDDADDEAQASESRSAEPKEIVEVDAAQQAAVLGATKYVHAAFFGAGILAAYLGGKLMLSGWNLLADWPDAVRQVPQLIQYGEDERGSITLAVGAVVGDCLRRAARQGLGLSFEFGVRRMTSEVNAEDAENAEEPKKRWYVVTTYSGYENKVKAALQERIRQHQMENRFGEILIPSETVTESAKDGKQRVKTKTSFPGYIFVEMAMSEHAWHIVKDTPKVTGFIGNQRPQEVKPPQIADLRKGIVEGAVKPKARHQFQPGDEVRVVVGAFQNFSGTVEEVKPDKQKLKVTVSIFGRPTPVELEFSQVEKR
jgi:transcriptional antiterminator NusG